MGAPQRTRGAYVNVKSAAATGDTSGMELETSADGDGIYIHYVAVDRTSSYGMTIGDASLLDQAVGVVTPTCVFGEGAMTTVIRRGQDSAGALPAEGDWIFNASVAAGDGFGISVLVDGNIYVPAGKFVTIRRLTVNTASDVSIGFSEALR